MDASRTAHQSVFLEAHDHFSSYSASLVRVISALLRVLTSVRNGLLGPGIYVILSVLEVIVSTHKSNPQLHVCFVHISRTYFTQVHRNDVCKRVISDPAVAIVGFGVVKNVY